MQFILVRGGVADPARVEVHPARPELAPEKGMWWAEVIPSSCPAFDGRWQNASGPVWAVDAVARTATQTWTVSAKALATVKTDRKAALAAYRYQRETAGITVGGAAIRTDAESQAKITGAHALVTAAPQTVIDWKGAAGWVQLDAATMTAIALAVGAHVQACYSAERTHAEAIDACATAEAAGTYDFTTGWP